MSPREVARAAGLSPREVAAVERGRRRLSPQELRALAGVLNDRPEVLVAGATSRGARRIRHPGTHRHRRRRRLICCLAAGAERRAPARTLPPPRRSGPTVGRDFNTRKQVEDSWSDVRAGMEGVIHQCMRVSTVGSGDDVLALLDAVEGEIRKLRTDHAFQREVARHQRTIAAAHGRGDGAARDAKAAGVRGH